jgi:hypothetical protein
MKQCLLAHDDIDAFCIKRRSHHVTFNDTDHFLKAHKRGQFLSARNPSGRKLNARNLRAVPMREVPRRASKPSTEISNARSFADSSSLCEFIVCRYPAVVVLVVRKQLLWCSS